MNLTHEKAYSARFLQEDLAEKDKLIMKWVLIILFSLLFFFAAVYFLKKVIDKHFEKNIQEPTE